MAMGCADLACVDGLAVSEQSHKRAQVGPPAHPNTLPGCPTQMSIREWLNGDHLQRLLPLLSPSQLADLRSMCEDFDTAYKELVAATAARDAVARVGVLWHRLKGGKVHCRVNTRGAYNQCSAARAAAKAWCLLTCAHPHPSWPCRWRTRTWLPPALLDPNSCTCQV